MPTSGGGSASAGNVQGGLHVSAYMGSPAEGRKRKKRSMRKEQPRTLYVNRPVTNAEDIIRWAKKQGFETALQPDDMHVTIAFSRAPVFWSAVGYGRNPITVDGGSRSLDRFGDGDCVVLRFDSGVLCDRWLEIIGCGASWGYPSYQPHITISWNAPDLDLTQIEPYTGPIELGPEEFSEVKDDWKDGVVEKVNLFVRDNLPVKLPQSERSYKSTPNGRQRCGRCAFYKGVLEENCDVLQGHVSENGWCEQFAWRQSQRSDKDIVNPSAQTWKDQMSTQVNKAGARHSKADVGMIQTIHDQAVKLGASCDGHDAFNEMRDDDIEKRAASARICKLDESLGLVMGWAIISKINGEPYYDLNIDSDGTRTPEHIPEDALLKASADFMESARPGNEMHMGPDKGMFVFALPWTTEIAKAYGYDNPPVTGLMVVYKPTPDVFAKFRDGTYRGFSIQGRRVKIEEAV
jgi:High potential iron-sulfur protein